ncbi:putative WD40 repeat-like protein [Lyophyllum shimeji]|uniref:WD40 repeat-like protein n=1 Tax=Lyophyllum shimeji TaxID=47721 RepID=A0A9P3PTN6_LYOSH|nr:putative WD40 repeat-like protein [Lyophyllum shimeji]
MPPPTEIIDVDEPIKIDLTGESDDEIQVISAPHTPPCNKRKQDRLGPPSTIQVPDRARTPLTSSAVEPPLKRQKVDGPQVKPAIGLDGVASKISPAPRPPIKGKSVKRELELIVLDSDGEEVDHKSKKIKRAGSPSSDDEESYERYHAGYDLNDEERWKPLKDNASKLTFDVAESFRHLTVTDTSSPRKRRAHPDFSNPPPYLYAKRCKWSNHHPGHFFLPPPRPVASLLPPQLLRSSRRSVVQPMKFLTSFKRAAGSINKIEQFGAWVAIGSASMGGNDPNPPNPKNLARLERQLPYNKEGFSCCGITMSTYSPVTSECGTPVGMSGTTLSMMSSSTHTVRPSCRLGRTRLYISGLRVNLNPSTYGDMATSHMTSLSNRSHRCLQSQNGISLFTLRSRTQHPVGSIAWGHGPTSSHIFASSEGDFTGFHKAFDVDRSTVAYQFDEEGSGDAMAVTDDGTRLALITRREVTHPLRLYDIRRKDPNAVFSMNLKPFPLTKKGKDKGEVSNAAFSSDGVYLALGRNDNHTHVYDSRMLDRLLFDYEHHGPSRVDPENRSFGVVKVQWVERQGIVPAGFVTGGNDGCVRFWDPLRAADSPQNGTVLAEVTSDVATFSLGDRFKGERALIVGDSAGEVSVFDICPATFPHATVSRHGQPSLAL